MNTASLAASLNDQVVDQIDGVNVTRGELSAAFDLVKNKKHWKNPINARVVIATPRDMKVIASAIIFFTGSHSEFVPVNGSTYRVRAAGYYATIGA